MMASHPAATKNEQRHKAETQLIFVDLWKNKETTNLDTTSYSTPLQRSSLSEVGRQQCNLDTSKLDSKYPFAHLSK